MKRLFLLLEKTGGYSLQQVPSNFAQALRLAAQQAEELERTTCFIRGAST